MALEPLQTTYITCIMTLFLCWSAQEIMERNFGMSPAIRRTTSLHDVAAKADNPIQAKVVVNRLTKQLDTKGRFRIQTRGTIYYIKGIWNILMWCVAIFGCLYDENWFIDHFIRLEASSATYLPYLHLTASILSFYAWEMCANRYAKLNYSIILHHWLTSLAALLILLGNFNPFATWYGFTAVQSVFPIWFILGLRATFSQQFPELTRQGFRFAFWWYLCIICLNMAGQVFLIINGLITGKIPIWQIALIICAIAGWMFDDVSLLKSLYDFSTHNYEDAELFEKKRTARELGGRSLFAKSILMDLGDFEKSKSNSGPAGYVSKSDSGHHLASPGSKEDGTTVNDGAGVGGGAETEVVKMSKEEHEKHRFSVENKMMNEIQIRLKQENSNKDNSPIKHTTTDSELNPGLTKMDQSIDSKEMGALAQRFKDKGTFHSTTNKLIKNGNTSDVDVNDEIVPTNTDRTDYSPVFVANAQATDHELHLQTLNSGHSNSKRGNKHKNKGGNWHKNGNANNVLPNGDPGLATIKSNSPVAEEKTGLVKPDGSDNSNVSSPSSYHVLNSSRV